jgi:hypothetical protein
MMKKNVLSTNLFDLFRKKSIEEIVLESFYFLIVDFGYSLIDIQQLDTNKYFAKHFYVYRNEAAGKQIEICFSETRFHCVFRRLIKGQIIKFSDKENNIPFYDLAILESRNVNVQYDDGYVYRYPEWKKTSQYLVNLIKRHHQFFTTDQWIDTELLKSIKRDDDIKKYGPIDKDLENKPSLFLQLQQPIWQYLKELGFEIIKDGRENSPFEIGRYEEMIFGKGNNTVSLFRDGDFRDGIFLNLSYNNQCILYIDYCKFPDMDGIIQLIRNSLKKEMQNDS